MKNKLASSLVVPLGKALNKRLHLYVADRWRTRASPGYNCEVAHPACRRRNAVYAEPPSRGRGGVITTTQALFVNFSSALFYFAMESVGSCLSLETP